MFALSVFGMWAAPSPSTIHQSLLTWSTWYPSKLVKDPTNASLAFRQGLSHARNQRNVQKEWKSCKCRDMSQGFPAHNIVKPKWVAKGIQNKTAIPTRRLDTRLRGWHEDPNGQPGALPLYRMLTECWRCVKVCSSFWHWFAWVVTPAGQVRVRRLAAKTFNS